MGCRKAERREQETKHWKRHRKNKCLREEGYEKTEMYIFMEEMEAIGDTWTLEEVERVYGNSTLDEALADRKGAMGMFFNAIESVLRRKDG